MTIQKADALQIIETHIQDNWTGSSVCWDNTKFDATGKPSWLRPTVQFGESRKLDLLKRERTVGVLIIQVFVPLFSGLRGATQLADQIAALFRSVTVNTIVFKVPSQTRVGDTKDGWFQVNVTIPFYWDTSF